MVVTLANVLLRQAQKTQNARDYLDTLITSKWDSVDANGGQIVGTTVNGKSVQLSVPSGASIMQIMAAAELALSALECGLTRVPRQTSVNLR